MPDNIKMSQTLVLFGLFWPMWPLVLPYIQAKPICWYTIDVYWMYHILPNKGTGRSSKVKSDSVETKLTFQTFKWRFRIENRTIIKEIVLTLVSYDSTGFLQTTGGTLIRGGALDWQIMVYTNKASYLCMKTVPIPSERAIAQACWPPAPPKHARTCRDVSYPFACVQ